MNIAGFLSIILIAIGLAADCFAVAMGASSQIKKQFWFQVLRISLSFGIFQGLMPVFGWLAGMTVVEMIQSFDHWIAFGLLTIIGGKMIRESFQVDDGRESRSDITGLPTLLILSLATSIDALAMGLSFAVLDINIVIASLAIGLVSLVATAIGLNLGRKVGQLIGKRAELIGGVILIIIGLKILLDHIM